MLTEKDRPFRLRRGEAERIAHEIRAALNRHRGMKLVLVHGGGSFGHYVAKAFLDNVGMIDVEGFCTIAGYMDELNRAVVEILNLYGVPAVSVTPRALFFLRSDGSVEAHSNVICKLLERNIVPVLYGDVVASDEGFKILSGDLIAWFLASVFKADRLLFGTAVDGVYDRDPTKFRDARFLSRLSLTMFSNRSASFAGSVRYDVTGGMMSKLSYGVKYIDSVGEVIIFNALRKGYVYKALTGGRIRCTRILP